MTTIDAGKHLLAAALALTLAGAVGAAQAADPASLQEEFEAAVADAEVAEPDEVVTTLFAITPGTEGQQWRGEGDDQQVKVVSWFSRGKLQATFPDQEVDAIPAEATGRAPVGRDVWVTVVPELQEFCQGLELTGDALKQRMKQHLGLNTTWTYHGLAELWVDPNDVNRPCADPEVTDTACELPGPADGVLEASGDGSVDQAYADWFSNMETISYGDSGAPWTRLGYTYDWGNPDSEVGASEYVLESGAPVTFAAFYTPDEYCAAQ